jgi:hypothetical protein
MSSKSSGKSEVESLEESTILGMRKMRKSPEGKVRLRNIVKKYLKTTSEGQAMVDSIAESSRDPVVCVLSPDGWIDVYGDRRRSEVAFYTKMPYQGSAEARLIAEKILESQMPERHRRIMWPNASRCGPGLIATEMVGLSNAGNGQMAFRFLNGRTRWLLKNGQLTTLEQLEDTLTTSQRQNKSLKSVERSGVDGQKRQGEKGKGGMK